MMLNYTIFPATAPKDLPPLLIAHGLFGSGRNWGVIARRLADQRDVIAVDMRNHGESPRFLTQSYAEMAEDLAQVISANGGMADVMGHSMGGKTAMVLALTMGALVHRLVVADIAPVAYMHDQRQNVAAMAELDLAGVTSRAQADLRLAQTITDPALRAFFLQSLDLRATPPRWRLNLEVLSQEMDKIIGWPGTAGQYSGRALFLSGANSSYVLPQHRALITAQFPSAYFARIPGAGHWLHAEKPREFEETVRIFLNA
jgi:esterase